MEMYAYGRWSTLRRLVSGHRKDVIGKIRGIVVEDHRVEVREIPDTVGIRAEREHNILHEKLIIKKVWARVVSLLLNKPTRERAFHCNVFRTLIAIRRTFCVIPHRGWSLELSLRRELKQRTVTVQMVLKEKAVLSAEKVAASDF